MNIAIVGYGAMGKIIERIAQTRGHSTVSFDAHCKADQCEITKETIKGIDMVIDFTQPKAVLENIGKYCDLKIPVVMGTTGWYDKLSEVQKQVKSAGIGFIYASNFSIGVNMFFRIIENAALLINNVDSYDVFGYELHHNRKKDSPSGTAKTIESILLKNIKRKKKVTEERLERQIAAD